jgi:phospholipase/carboxylesterase
MAGGVAETARRTADIMNRRGFLRFGAAGAAGLLYGAGSARAQNAPAAPQAPPDPAGDGIPYGRTALGISDDGRDGTLYVPKAYRHGSPAPLLVMLHGFAGWGDEMRSTFALAEEFGVVVIAPESRDVTWGKEIPGFDADVRYIGAAYRKVAAFFDLDPNRVALAGRSDGAGYALSMGLAYGDTFNHLLIFAGGSMLPYRRQGKPKIFIAHGTEDRTMPVDVTGRRFAAQLKAEGYPVTYPEHEGGHGTPLAVVREGLQWFVGSQPR